MDATIGRVPAPRLRVVGTRSRSPRFGRWMERARGLLAAGPALARCEGRTQRAPCAPAATCGVPGDDCLGEPCRGQRRGRHRDHDHGRTSREDRGDAGGGAPCTGGTVLSSTPRPEGRLGHVVTSKERLSEVRPAGSGTASPACAARYGVHAPSTSARSAASTQPSPFTSARKAVVVPTGPQQRST